MRTLFLSLLILCFAGCASLHNTCVLDAVSAKARLPKTAWSRIVSLRVDRMGLRHSYLVFDAGNGNVYSWDQSGSVPLGRSRELAEIGLTLAMRYGYYAAADYQVSFADAIPGEGPVIIHSLR